MVERNFINFKISMEVTMNRKQYVRYGGVFVCLVFFALYGWDICNEKKLSVA